MRWRDGFVSHGFFTLRREEFMSKCSTAKSYRPTLLA